LFEFLFPCLCPGTNCGWNLTDHLQPGNHTHGSGIFRLLAEWAMNKTVVSVLGGLFDEVEKALVVMILHQPSHRLGQLEEFDRLLTPQNLVEGCC
jgi:hypothetical protein